MAIPYQTQEEERVTSCRCHFCGSGSCNVNVHTVGDQIVRVLPDPTWPNCMGHCTRLKNDGRAAIEYHYHPERINYPMKRLGERGSGQWERISWDQACQEVAAKLLEIKATYGPEAIAACGGTARYGDATWSKSKFLNTMGSPQNHGNEQICHGPGTKAYECTVGWFTQGYMSPNETRCIVTNSNQHESHPPLMSLIEQLKATGCKIISVNPRMTETGMISDYWLPVRPGSDGAMYMAWMHVIIEEELYDKEFVEGWTTGFDELREVVKDWTPEKAAEICWVPAYKIAEAARVFATNTPGRMLGWQSYDGSAPNGFRTMRCCAILDALVGGIDTAAPVVVPLTEENGGFQDDFHAEMNHLVPESMYDKQIGGNRFRVLGYPGWKMLGEYQQKMYGTQMYTFWSNQGHAPMLWRQIISEDPFPVKAVILNACGALTKYSNPQLILEAFKKLDLLVVADFFPNPATEMADYIFPMSDWMERPLIETYLASFSGCITAGKAAVEPLYERRSDYEFYQSLAEACGIGEYWPQKTITESHDFRLKASGMTFEELATSPSKRLATDIEFKRYAKANPKTGLPWGFATPSGKAEFKSGVLEKLGYDPIMHYEEPNFSHYSTPEYAEEYPYILVCGQRTQPFFHSEFRQIPALRMIHPDPIVEVNVQHAQMMDPPLRDGDWAYIETHMGRIKMKVRCTTAIAPGIIQVEHNWWFPEEDPKYPHLYGAFKSNCNVLLDDNPDICGQEMGNYTCKHALCKIYRA